LHIWNEVMRRAVIFPWMAPSPGSYMAELFDRHAIGFGHAPAYTADELQRLSDNYFGAETWLHDIAENAELTRLRLRLASMQAQAGALEAEVLQLRERIGMLLNSTIWRLTAPLRWLVNALRR
jgi:hypothetical protein